MSNDGGCQPRRASSDKRRFLSGIEVVTYLAFRHYTDQQAQRRSLAEPADDNPLLVDAGLDLLLYEGMDLADALENTLLVLLASRVTRNRCP